MEITKNAAVEIHLKYNEPKPHKNSKNGQGSLYRKTAEKDDVCFSPEALASIFRVHLVVLLLNAWISKLFANAVRRSHRLENAAGVYAVPGQMFEQTRNVLS